jgi:hypothetical protein
MSAPPKLDHRSYLMLAAGLLIGYLSGTYVERQADPPSAPQEITKAHSTEVESNLGNSRPRRLGQAPGDDPGTDSALFAKPSSKELAATVRSIFRETMGERRFAMFESLLDRVGLDEYGSLVSLIRENDLRGNDTGIEWSKLWVAWGRRDPAGAFEFLQSQDWTGWDPSAPIEARNRTLTSWAQTDPEEARKFVESGGGLADGDRSMVYGLVRGWVDVDPYAAADWLSKTGLGRRGEYEAVVESISRKGGREELDRWFATLTENGTSARDKQGFAQVIAEVKQEYEPEKAAAWVEKHLAEPWLGESEIVESTAYAFAQRDPQGAMEWATKTGLESATITALGAWCEKDFAAASEWLSANPQNPAFAQSATVLLGHLHRSDPDAALTWIQSLPESEVRSKLLDQLQPH